MKHPKIEYPETGKCCLCGGAFTHYGNNPFPLCDAATRDLRCCDVCNCYKVIPARLRRAARLEAEKAVKE